MKMSVDIEDLLVWAYRTELPKEQVDPVMPAALRPGWSSMSNFSNLMAVVDERDVRNVYGVTPDRLAESGPHFDALAVDAAVSDLAGMLVDVPDAWWPFADMASPDEWGDLGRQVVADVLSRLCLPGDGGTLCFKTAPAWLVRKHAMMGTVPDWGAEPIEHRSVRGANGKAKWFMKRMVAQTVNGEIIGYVEHEVDGWCGSRRRPYPGAYHKMELAPSPFYVACDRAEYEIWRAALATLADMLGESLVAHRVTGPKRPARPWEPGGAQPRVLPSLRGMGTDRA